MSIIKDVTLQKIVAHDFRYDPRNYRYWEICEGMFSGRGYTQISAFKLLSDLPEVKKNTYRRFRGSGM